MALKLGTRLDPYEITALIGAGGMGEVYRATDTKLKREVAIKILPEDFAQHAARLARFRREAQVLASLNHPNIAAIHGLEELEGVPCLVLELVEGATLAERLAGGPLPIDEVLTVVRQIASALEAAHEKGIVHRDLKPANVKVSPDGTVKVLDFGLAKAFRDDASIREDSGPTEAQTVTAGETRDGVILGTAPYMSPEQARGKPVDKRADIWSLGCVLYECLTGRRPFDGATTTDVLAQILSHQPDFGLLPGATPDCLARLLRRCLDKNPSRRLRDAGEARILIEEFMRDPHSEILGPASAPPRRGSFLRLALPWSIVAALALTLIYISSGRAPRSVLTSPAITHWSITLPRASRVGLPSPGGGFDHSRMVAVSRDGSRIAFSVQKEEDRAELYLKVDAAEPRPIPHTTDARGPFFSPDGQWLGFYQNNTRAIYKTALDGGSPQRLCGIERTISFDASWAPDGASIVFATDEGLWRVPSAGGTPERLTKPNTGKGEAGHLFPRFGRDGRGVFFTVSATPQTHAAWLSLDTGKWEIVLKNASLVTPIAEDQIVFARSGELLSARYDPATHRIRGTAVPVFQGIQTSPGLRGVVLTHYDISDTGTLVYVPAASGTPDDQLLWVDSKGNETVITSGPGTWVHPRLSPDGRRISLDIHGRDGMRDLYIYELQRGQLRELTKTGQSWESEWRPDGKRIALLSGALPGQWSLYWVPTDFSGPPELLYRTRHAIPGSWLPDGTALLFTEWVEGGIWRISPEGERKPRLVMQTSAQEGFPRLSPDGKWMAFVEVESGQRQVFVQPFPGLGPKYKVSIDGGGEPVWSRDGRRLFFRHGDEMLSVDVSYEPAIGFGRPRVLFTGNYDSAEVGHQHYDISLDGTKFLMVKHGERVGPREVRVVLNWSGTLEDRLASSP